MNKTANKNFSLLSEEDVRTKVVTAWLADHGFGPGDLSIEYSFEVQMGRSVLQVGADQDDINDYIAAQRRRANRGLF